MARSARGQGLGHATPGPRGASTPASRRAGPPGRGSVARPRPRDRGHRHGRTASTARRHRGPAADSAAPRDRPAGHHPSSRGRGVAGRRRHHSPPAAAPPCSACTWAASAPGRSRPAATRRVGPGGEVLGGVADTAAVDGEDERRRPPWPVRPRPGLTTWSPGATGPIGWPRLQPVPGRAGHGRRSAATLPGADVHAVAAPGRTGPVVAPSARRATCRRRARRTLPGDDHGVTACRDLVRARRRLRATRARGARWPVRAHHPPRPEARADRAGHRRRPRSRRRPAIRRPACR
jgi:hypothetical protein